MKHLLVNVTLREGETEFPGYKKPMAFEGNPSEDAIYESTIKELFGEPEFIDDRGRHEYRSGEYVVYGCTYQIIDEEDFDILSKYL